MNTEQAREILSSLKKPDREDPLVKEAMELATGNPELREWIDKQEALDEEITGALADLSVPDGLEQKLLNTVNEARPKRNRNKMPFIWTFGIAAMLIFGIGFGVLVTNPVLMQKMQVKLQGESIEDFDSFRDGMAFLIAKTLYRLDHRSSDLTAIGNWLDEKQAPVYEGLPDALLALKPIGCKEFEWRGQTVSLVCFHSGEGKIVHLFMVDRAGIPEDAYKEIATIARSSGLQTGGWATGSKVYLLVGSDPDVDIGFALG